MGYMYMSPSATSATEPGRKKKGQLTVVIHGIDLPFACKLEVSIFICVLHANR